MNKVKTEQLTILLLEFVPHGILVQKVRGKIALGRTRVTDLFALPSLAIFLLSFDRITLRVVSWRRNVLAQFL